jgi:monoterpene epsilon-lactone hydrolase
MLTILATPALALLLAGWGAKAAEGKSMSREQLDVIVGMMRSGGGVDLAQPALAARAQFTEMLARIPPPEGVEFDKVEAGGVPAFWSNDAKAAQDRVLLYLHGGGYVIGEPWGYRPLWSGLARACGARGLGVDYRLGPEHPFPAAVEDAVAAYRWLLDQGFAPGRIAVAGDSAGGGLAIAMMVQALRLGLPMPAAALAISPWVDLASAGGSIVSKAAEDPSLTVEGLHNCARQYLAGASVAEPLASPVHADLTGICPLLIQVGSAEILLDDAVRLAGRAGAAEVEVQLQVWPQMPHVWHAFAFMLDEGMQATLQAAEFLKSRMQS